jgi:hypothetical protein
MSGFLDELFRVHGADVDIRHFTDFPIVFADRIAELGYSLSLADRNGLHLEFGVFRGRSISRLAAFRPDVTFYGFDSFQGLPEPWHRSDASVYPKGHFTLARLPDVPGNVRLVRGFFENTLDGWLKAHSEDVAFIHIDSDLYSSAAFVLKRLTPRIRCGTIIVFDELCDWRDAGVYPYWREGEWRALGEWLSVTGFRFRILSRDFAYSSAIEILDPATTIETYEDVVKRAKALWSAGRTDIAAILVAEARDRAWGNRSDALDAELDALLAAPS